MPVADPLSPAAEAQWRALVQPDEEVLLTVASDVDAGGRYGERWLVVTNRRVVVLPDGETNDQGRKTNGHSSRAEAGPSVVVRPPPPDGALSLPIETLTEVKTEPHVGGGRLEAYQGIVPVPLVEYTSSLGPKFSEVARGLQQLIKGHPFSVSDDLPKLRCERCGRLLAEKNAPCGRCVRKSAILMRLLRYMQPVWPLALVLAVATGGRTIVQLAPPYFQKLMIDQILTPPLAGGPPKPHYGDYGRLVLYVLGTAGAGLATALLMILASWLAAVVGTRVTVAIRADLYRALERLSLSFHNKREQG